MKLARKPKNVCSTAVKRARPGQNQNGTAMMCRLRTVEGGPGEHGEEESGRSECYGTGRRVTSLSQV